ncbi:MAG: hypothetical protein H7Y00_01845 [Fimbriimonadaceae bacterium]|nr:hypothetical protein [Chitinophagales bacterium]
MKKRQFKKLLQYEITDAVELVILKYAKEKPADESIQNKKIDALLDLYDETFSKISGERTLKTSNEKKTHFKSLHEDFHKEVEKIYLDK